VGFDVGSGTVMMYGTSPFLERWVSTGPVDDDGLFSTF
jgi:hypothetical protein